MKNKASFKLIIILFAFSLVFTYADAVPWSRSLKSISASISVLDVKDQISHGQFQEQVESFVGVQRMDFEINDYAGTGANQGHDPKPPGTN